MVTELVRTVTDLTIYRDGGHPSTEYVESVHPALPAAAVQAVMRDEFHSHLDPSDTPLSWRHYDGNAWGVVDRLHRTDRHDEACDLARLLRWTERSYSHAQAHYWTLRPLNETEK